eukprot:2848211-Rhodomonas_salina.4
MVLLRPSLPPLVVVQPLLPSGLGGRVFWQWRFSGVLTRCHPSATPMPPVSTSPIWPQAEAAMMSRAPRGEC